MYKIGQYLCWDNQYIIKVLKYIGNGYFSAKFIGYAIHRPHYLQINYKYNCLDNECRILQLKDVINLENFLKEEIQPILESLLV